VGLYTQCCDSDQIEEYGDARCSVPKTVLLKGPDFWDVTQCCWKDSSSHFKLLSKKTLNA